MAWVSKFSGLPTLTILPVAGDLYAAGTFTIGAGFPSFTRDWMVGLAFPPSSDESPIAYETLAGMSASIAQVLRVTARYASRSPTSGFSIGAGVALFGPGTDDAVGVSSEENAPVFFPGDGNVYAAAIENDVHTSVAFTPISAATPPHQFRLYWNGTGSAFIIPDAGFGSWSVAANTVSYWRSIDDGTTWVREGDRAIAGGVAPTRVGIFFGSQPTQNQNDTVTFSNLEVMEEGAAPIVTNKIQPYQIHGERKAEEEFTATQVGTESFTLADPIAGSTAQPSGYMVHVYVGGIECEWNAAPGARQFRIIDSTTVEVGGLVIGDEVEIVYGVE